MPFKSKAQRDRALHQLERNEITKEQFDKWDEGTPAELPERLHPKKEKVPHYDDIQEAKAAQRDAAIEAQEEMDGTGAARET